MISPVKGFSEFLLSKSPTNSSWRYISRSNQFTLLNNDLPLQNFNRIPLFLLLDYGVPLLLAGHKIHFDLSHICRVQSWHSSSLSLKRYNSSSSSTSFLHSLHSAPESDCSSLYLWPLRKDHEQFLSHLLQQIASPSMKNQIDPSRQTGIISLSGFSACCLLHPLHFLHISFSSLAFLSNFCIYLKG